MFDGPIRGGTRGGQGEFKWSDVSADKDRENYLGHSINAPTGRWQKNKDVHWYNRDMNAGEAERQEEIRKIKEAEAEALSVALGFKPAPKPGAPEPGPSSPSKVEADDKPPALEDPAILAAKEEKRREKEDRHKRKEEKRLKKEMRRARKLEHGDSERSDKRRIKYESDNDEERSAIQRYRTHARSRSRSPRRGSGRDRTRPLSRSPADYYDRRAELRRSLDGRDRDYQRAGRTNVRR
ncbi:kinase phosphorylation protein-domain-containing protein [Hysterangium stoloniferum]|nr:kinase phosphorylation protein-domain-containing protein [Hysterangium stoloniferum]